MLLLRDICSGFGLVLLLIYTPHIEPRSELGRCCRRCPRMPVSSTRRRLLIVSVCPSNSGISCSCRDTLERVLQLGSRWPCGDARCVQERRVPFLVSDVVGWRKAGSEERGCETSGRWSAGGAVAR